MYSMSITSPCSSFIMKHRRTQGKSNQIKTIEFRVRTIRWIKRYNMFRPICSLSTNILLVLWEFQKCIDQNKNTWMNLLNNYQKVDVPMDEIREEIEDWSADWWSTFPQIDGNSMGKFLVSQFFLTIRLGT